MHLTLAVLSHTVEAMVTVPNSVNSGTRRKLLQLDEDGFTTLAKDIVTNLKPLLRKHKGAAPWFRDVQRRFSSRRAVVPYLDARIEFD